MNTGLMHRNAREWNPVLDLQRGIDRLFSDFLRSGTDRSSIFNPACDVEETDSHYVMAFDLPGMKKDDIRVEMIDNQLIVSGTRKSEDRKGDRQSRIVERSYGEFQRVFNLPAAVDAERVEASYEDGVLRLAVPKAESTKPRQIKIGEGKTGFFSKLLGQDKRESEAAGKAA